jgi:hypothetical protein
MPQAEQRLDWLATVLCRDATAAQDFVGCVQQATLTDKITVPLQHETVAVYVALSNSCPSVTFCVSIPEFLMTKTSLALLGLGRWGSTLVRSVQNKSDRVKFVAAITRDKAKHRETAEAFGLELLPDLEAALVRHQHPWHRIGFDR